MNSKISLSPEKKKIIHVLLLFLMFISAIFTGCGKRSNQQLKAASDKSSGARIDSEENNDTGVNTETGENGEDQMTTQELDFERDGLIIRGELYVPANPAGISDKESASNKENIINKNINDNKNSTSSREKFPIVILCHGFGSSHRYVSGYTRHLTDAGLAVYAFDFCGGGYSSDSDGSMTDMSVLTEKADLEAVLEGIRGQDFCDTDNVFLLGESQGGFVSAITAADHADEIRAMVLFYPAFVIPDDALESYPDADSVPDTYSIMGMRVGRIYYTDALKADVWNTIGKYDGNVLIEHGTSDSIVPYEYSERAVKLYQHAELIPIQDSDHGFYGRHEDTAMKNAVEFIRNNIK